MGEKGYRGQNTLIFLHRQYRSKIARSQNVQCTTSHEYQSTPNSSSWRSMKAFIAVFQILDYFSLNCYPYKFSKHNIDFSSLVTMWETKLNYVLCCIRCHVFKQFFLEVLNDILDCSIICPCELCLL